MSRAENSQSAEAIRGRATGALFFVGFGAVWTLMGLASLHRMGPESLTPVIGVLLLLGYAAVALLRRARTLSPGNRSRLEAMRMQRVFRAVNIIQWVAAATAVVVLNLLHLPQFIASAVAIIVALHLYPLAMAFRYRLHHATATMILLWSIACMVRLQPERLPGVQALGTGIILLFSAAATTLLAFQATRAHSFQGVAAHSS